jgi:hypothetical protein
MSGSLASVHDDEQPVEIFLPIVRKEYDDHQAKTTQSSFSIDDQSHAEPITAEPRREETTTPNVFLAMAE